jgi:hypothetical protein
VSGNEAGKSDDKEVLNAAQTSHRQILIFMLEET